MSSLPFGEEMEGGPLLVILWRTFDSIVRLSLCDAFTDTLA